MQVGLEPDLVGSVTQIPASNDSFDVSLCCQVLEHLPFEQFIPPLKELRRVTRNVLVMSLPDQSPYFYVKFLLPKSIGFNWEFSRPKLRLPVLSREGSGQCGHFWEIGLQRHYFAECVRRNNFEPLANRAHLESAGDCQTPRHRTTCDPRCLQPNLLPSNFDLLSSSMKIAT